jgi:hypothetical protein
MTLSSILSFLGWNEIAKYSPLSIPTTTISMRTRAISLSLLFTILLFSAASASAQTFSGEAAAVKTTVTVPLLPVLTTAINDTGPLPSAGGSINLASAGATVPNIIAISDSTVSTSGSGLTSQSTASVDSLDTQIGPFSPLLRVRAGVVSSTTLCSCPARTCTGSSSITDLRIGTAGGGTVITVTGAPNQSVAAVVVGTVTLNITINEQIISPGSITVNALHINLTDSLTGTSTDIIVSSAHSDITCAISPLTPFYSGRATGIRSSVRTLPLSALVTTIVSDTGFLPTSGGAITASTASATLPGLLTSGTVTSNTFGGLAGAPTSNVNSSLSNSTVQNLQVTALGALGLVTIDATVVSSNTLCTCSFGIGTCTGGSQVVALTVTALGIPVVINVTGAPNQGVVLPLGLGGIIINEQFGVGTESVTVNALHINLNVLGVAGTDIVIAHSHSDIDCGSIGPTAALASVSGQVLNSERQGIPNAIVSFSNSDGETFSGRTNQFGFFKVAGLPAGESYIANVRAKGYSFISQVVTVEDDIVDLNFIAEP